MRSSLIVFSLVLASCAPVIQTKVIPCELSRPERPVLPKIKASQLQCLDLQTYQALYDRQRVTTDYAIELETIIDSTHRPATEK